jgi:hypothetical protein
MTAPSADSVGALSATSAAPVHLCEPLALRLPVLRRPPGWTLLDERALQARATLLFLGCVPMPQGGPQANAPIPPSGPAAPSTPIVATTPAAAPARDTAGPSAPPKQKPRPHPRPSPRVWRAWPLLLWTLGLMFIAPWLVWAPLVGGLCLGILLVQTGLLRRWLAVQRAHAESAIAAESGGQPLGDAVHLQTSVAAASASALTPVQGRGPARLRIAHGGWLLTAALVLLGVQAAMVIATIQIRRADVMLQAVQTRAGADARTALGAAPATVVLGLPELQPSLGQGSSGARSVDEGARAQGSP